MEKTETTRKYELMVIVDAHLGSEEKESIFKEIAEVIKKTGGRVINGQVWMEKHRLTFTIKKRKEGTYYLINFEGEGKVVLQIETALRLNDKVLRFAVTKVESRAVPEAAKA